MSKSSLGQAPLTYMDKKCNSPCISEPIETAYTQTDVYAHAFLPRTAYLNDVKFFSVYFKFKNAMYIYSFANALGFYVAITNG